MIESVEVTGMSRASLYAKLEALPEHVVGEILEGELVTSPRPRLEHGFTSEALGVFIGGPYQFGLNGPGGWWIIDEPELHLGEDVVIPDLAGWRRERMTSPTGVRAEVPPDWACEILSPSTARYDRGPKLRTYARSGVEWVWLVDPAAQMIEVLHREGTLWTIVQAVGEEERARLEPFASVELELARLWAPAPPSAT